MGKKIDFEKLLNVDPERAVEYLKEKGYKVTKDWRESWKSANNRAFTITGVMKEDILKDVKEVLTQSMKQGLGYENFKKNIDNRMRTKGWYIAPWRLKTIYRTNMDVAYSIGRFEYQNSVKESVPYWQYVTMNDEKVRPAHAYLHNKVFKASDKIWDVIYPPNGFNCRCHVRNYTRDELKRKGLKVENSEGRVKPAYVEVGPVGDKRRVRTHAIDGYKIDPGWDYNPGKENFKGRK